MSTFKKGDQVEFMQTSILSPGKQFKKVGVIIHDHGDGRYNVNTNTPHNKTKSYPSTVHQDKLKRLGEENLDEVSIAKRVKRAFQFWDKSVDDGPKELVKRNKSYDDETVKKLYKGRENEPASHTPHGLQTKVLKGEMRKRGLGEAVSQKPTHIVHYVRDSDPQQNVSKFPVSASNDTDARTKLHQNISHEGGYRIKKVVKLSESITEEAEMTLEESKMSELHAAIGTHMDKHIDHYKKVGGAEHLMSKAEGAAKKISKSHGLAPEHATKFVSSYIDSKLNEEVDLDEDILINEISQKLKAKYAEKAIGDHSTHAMAAGRAKSPLEKKYHERKAANRNAGVAKALNTEETEKKNLTDSYSDLEEVDLDNDLYESDVKKGKQYTYTKPDKNGLYKEIHNHASLEDWKKHCNANYRPGVNQKVEFHEAEPGVWHGTRGNRQVLVGKYHTTKPKQRWIQYVNIGGPG